MTAEHPKVTFTYDADTAVRIGCADPAVLRAHYAHGRLVIEVTGWFGRNEESCTGIWALTDFAARLDAGVRFDLVFPDPAVAATLLAQYVAEFDAQVEIYSPPGSVHDDDWEPSRLVVEGQVAQMALIIAEGRYSYRIAPPAGTQRSVPQAVVTSVPVGLPTSKSDLEVGDQVVFIARGPVTAIDGDGVRVAAGGGGFVVTAAWKVEP